jgi:electron transfer flavoprotein alpha subunit
MSNIIVIAEARSGQLKKTSLEAVTAGKELAGKAGGEVVAIIAGDDLNAAKEALASSGADKVVAVQSDALAQYSGDGYATAIAGEVSKLDPACILMAHSAMGRDLAPRLAANLKTGLISDVTAIHFDDGKFGATKPVFAGKAYRKSYFEKAPFMATLRPNNWAGKSDGGSAEVSEAAASITAADLKAIVQEVVAAASDRTPLQEARVVVAGGRGLKEPEKFTIVEDLAAAFGPGVAAVGASRAVVDAGWRPHREQVGQTGKVVAPTLYFACGISGAIQHLAGMSTSQFIVAINKDANAPIFKVANYGIVGDVFEVLPALTEAIKAAV